MGLDAKQYQLNNKMSIKMNKKAQEGGTPWFYYVGIALAVILLVLVIIWLVRQGSILDYFIK